MDVIIISCYHDRIPAEAGHRGPDQLEQVQGGGGRGLRGCGDGALPPERGRAQRGQQGQHGQLQVPPPVLFWRTNE